MTDAISSPAKEATSRELLSFRVGDQEYCVDILSVREIRGWTRPTLVPGSPPWLRGVVNLRGTVLPIVDLARRLGIEAAHASDRAVIIVVDLGQRNVGLRVDAVSDIISIPDADLRPPPDIASRGGAGFIRALTDFDERMLRVLDLVALLPDGGRDAA